LTHTFVRQVLNIQDSDLDTLFGKQLYYDLANAIAASRHDDNLATPHIGIAAPVVGHPIVEPAVDSAQRTQAQQCLQTLENCRMVSGKGSALLCIARKKNEGKRNGGIEGRVSDETAYGIASHAYRLC
jgi:hypothetical protein